jgi:cell wall-associated NlpC family hydrolase
VLTVGALALAVIAPAVDPAEHATEALQAPSVSPANPEPPAYPAGAAAEGLAARAVPGGFDESLYQQRQSASARASRAMQRRAAAIQPAPLAPLRVRPAAASPPRRSAPLGAPRRPAVRAAQHGLHSQRTGRAERSVLRRQAVREQRRVVVAQRRTTVSHRGMVRTSVRRTVARPLRVARGGQMGAVLAYARSQLGKRYVTGGEGRGGFDCSGLTRQAYARAGMRLPHSSRAQAARARNVPRGQAQPGDLVVGPGHVGIYMGRGMMIDAGNHRTGVVYRKVYRGLKVKRIR